MIVYLIIIICGFQCEMALCIITNYECRIDIK